MVSSRLSPFQREVLEAIFARAGDSEVQIPDGAKLPGGVTPGELRVFVDELVVRLRRAAHP